MPQAITDTTAKPFGQANLVRNPAEPYTAPSDAALAAAHRPNEDSNTMWERSRALSAMAAAVTAASETPWSHRPRPGYQAGNEPMEPYMPGDARKNVRLGVLLSGDATHGYALSEAIHAGQLPGCSIGIVVSNVPGAAGIDSARAAGLPAVTIEGRGREQNDHEQALDALLRRMRVDLVCLCGYGRTLSNAFVRRWPGRILMVHPSLQPSLPGGDPAAQALESGTQITGCTVQVLNDSLEGGAILTQQTVAVEDADTRDTLADRLLAAERQALVEGLRRYTAGGWEVRGRRLVRRQGEAKR